jgi:hypothetical protein
LRSGRMRLSEAAPGNSGSWIGDGQAARGRVRITNRHRLAEQTLHRARICVGPCYTMTNNVSAQTRRPASARCMGKPIARVLLSGLATAPAFEAFA